MLKDRMEDSFTFDDVLLLPGYSKVLPADVSVKSKITQILECNIPLLSAAMDTVTEHQTAICMAQEGGIGIIHKNMTAEDQATQVKMVKRSESGMISDPITVEPDEPLQNALNLMEQYRISGVPVTRGSELVGILTNRDLRFETNFEQPVSALMTGGRQRLITVAPGIEMEEAKRLLHKHRIEKLLVVSDNYELVGLITIKDIEKARKYPESIKDHQGRLRVGAALGTTVDLLSRAEILIKEGVDVVVLDTAHGHSQGVIDSITKLRSTFPDLQIIGGNIATGEAAEALVKAGADAVKVGIGPGSICTTRMVAGIGVPQMTAIDKVSHALRKTNIPIIADGGIKYSGDIVKAISAGAHTVMIGSLFAGTAESPGQVVLYQGRRYKIYRGMGSLGAMKEGSKDRYFQAHIDEDVKFVPEGIEGRVPFKGHLSESIYQFVGGLRAGMGYTGSATIENLRNEPRFVKITAAGLRESHAHDIFITEEAPNYPMNVKS
ncbi:MAG: IMP dehydrogenase [SAR324 cluster bacterium]|nr:IMP dehydrogenase [SAR324 cluster bacterium]MBL7035834.1 IMP dehydrogenase [SAR324 cluster bacterium]